MKHDLTPLCSIVNYLADQCVNFNMVDEHDQPIMHPHAKILLSMQEIEDQLQVIEVALDDERMEENAVDIISESYPFSYDISDLRFRVKKWQRKYRHNICRE